MTYFAGYQSALDYWFSQHARRGARSTRCDTLPSEPLSSCPPDPEDFSRRGISTEPLHLIVGKADHRCKRRGIMCHVMTGPIPKDSFERISSDCWVSSPELCFCQMASTLPLIDLVKRGFELCARFSINPFTRDIERSDPLTTTRSLADYCARYGSRKGADRARMALQYVLDGAESPMEIAVAMLLTLPKRHGGYGIGGAVLNDIVKLPRRTRTGATITYRGDLVWRRARLVVEYDSKLFHESPESIERDSLRRNNLLDGGWKVITLTREHVRNHVSLDETAAQIARAAGIRNPGVPKNYAKAREALRKLLLT